MLLTYHGPLLPAPPDPEEKVEVGIGWGGEAWEGSELAKQRCNWPPGNRPINERGLECLQAPRMQAAPVAAKLDGTVLAWMGSGDNIRWPYNGHQSSRHTYVCVHRKVEFTSLRLRKYKPPPEIMVAQTQFVAKNEAITAPRNKGVDKRL